MQTMQFILFFISSAVLLVLALAVSLSIRWFRQEKHSTAKLLGVTLLTSASIMALRMPLFLHAGESWWEGLLHGVIAALQTVSLETDPAEIIQSGSEIIGGDGLLFRLYAAYVIIQYVVGLALCGYALVKSLSRVLVRTFLRFSRETVFFFSHLSEESIAMVASLHASMEQCGRRSIICFVTPEDELDSALADAWQQADMHHALRFTGSLDRKLFPRFAPVVNCILCHPEEQVNVDALSALLEESGTGNERYFVFAHSRQAEQAVDVFTQRYADGQGRLMVCMINPMENLAVHVLDEIPLHEYAPDSGEMHVLVAGRTPLADRFLRNAYACGQMHGARLRITLADPEAEAYRSSLMGDAPLLRQADHPVVRQCGEVRFHTLATRDDIADEELLQGVNYVLLAYEDDMENIRAARRIQRILGRRALTDPALAAREAAVVYCVQDDVMNRICREADAAAVDGCRMHAVGARGEQFDAERLFGAELLRRAFFLEQAYNGSAPLPTDEAGVAQLQRDYAAFMNRAYNRRSSVAGAVHLKYRRHLLAELDLQGDALNAALINLEHRRWCAYMIMAGYLPPTPEQLESYFYRGGNTHKNSRLHLHPSIVCSEPALTPELWNFATPAADGMDQCSRDLHALLLKRLRGMGLGVDLTAPRPEDKPAIVAAAEKSGSDTALRMARALFTDYKQFDLDIVLHTEDILRKAEETAGMPALRLFWLEVKE